MTGPAEQVNEKALARRVKDHVQGKGHDFFAVVQPGFEETAGRELGGLGIGEIKSGVAGGVEFHARLDDAWRVNMGAGTISRVLMRLVEFKATGFGEFRSKLAAFPWELHLADTTLVAFSIHAGRSRLWHEGKLEEEAARAVAERLAVYGRRAQFIEKANSDPASRQTVYVHMIENRCQVSLDTSGELLYRRGYGKFVEQAPLRETLACCILRAAAVEQLPGPGRSLLRLGHFLTGGRPIFSGRPCNAGRRFAFEGWPGFRPALPST